MPADAKYYLTYDGHIGGGGGDNYPELPTDADTYDPFSGTWSCSHPGYAEGNCRLCGEPCPGHTYDNACDAECNVCSEIREVGDHVYDNDCDADCNVCSEVRDISGHIYEYACDTHCYLCDELTRPEAEHRRNGEVCEDCQCAYGCGLEMPATAQHEWECYHEKAPDCGNQGEAFYRCTVCGNTYEEYSPVVGEHEYDNACDVECNVCYFVREGSGHVYDNACDAECNVCSEIREVGDHVYDGAEDAECNECGFVRTVGPALITGMSITIDGVVYDSSNTSAEDPAVITPNTGFITITVHGTALQNCTVDHVVSYYSGSSEPILPDYLWRFEADGTSAFHHYSSASALSDFARNTTPYELQYSNNGSFNAANPAIGSGVYIVYDDSTGGEEDTTPAEITGISVTVDGVEYTSGNVTITPTSTVTLTVTGTNLQNGTDDNIVNYANGAGDPVGPDYFEISEDGTIATYTPHAKTFVNSSNFEITYYNNYTDSNNRITVPTGIYLTYDDSTGGEEDTTPAEITGVSITVDGVEYTEGEVTITPDTQSIIYTVTGMHFANLSENNNLSFAHGEGILVAPGYGWSIDTEANTATLDFSQRLSWFESCNNFEVKYSNDGNNTQIGTGIYLTYDDGTGGGEDTTPAEITGVSITVDGVTYTEGDVTITPTSTVVFTAIGTNFANASEDNILELGPGLTIFMNSFRWKIDSDANTATADFSDLNSEFGDHNDSEIMYSNGGGQGLTGTGIYLTYDDGTGGEEDTTPDSTGKILVDMLDSYCDGWNDAAIQIYKNGSLEQTVTVDKDFNTLSLDYDSTATYEFKWVKGSYDGECSFTIYVDGEEKLKVENAAVYENGETIWSLDDTGGEEGGDDPIEPSGPVITQQPTDSEAKLGERYCVEVIAQGEELKYQWYFKNAGSEQWHKSGVTDNTYDDVMTTARAGREVYCVITDADGNSVTTETAKLIAVKTAELVITQQPNDSSAKLDEMFCVEVLAEGDGLKYQWYWRQIGDENWTVSGQRDNTYDDVMTSARHNREVYCVITDAWGDSVTTEIATITGTPTTTLAITRQPESQSVTIGDMFNVTFEAQGDGLKYQWYFRQAGTEVWYTSAQKDNSYDDVMTKARHNRELYCVVTDAWGNTVETDPIVVILATPRYELAITAQPENESVKMGEMFCVTVEAQGDELKYQWYWRTVGSENWNVSGQRDNTYDDVMTKARHNREVKCVITDMWGESVETEIATITAIPNEVLAIVAQPTDAAAAMGENYCVTVEAQGDGLTYQWYFKNAGTDVWHVSGVKDNTYDDVMIESRAGRQVYCVITDIWGNTVTTETVTLVCTDIPQAIAKN